MVEKTKGKKRRKILVTGSSGMLGACLCEELSDSYDIVGLDVQELSAISYQLSAFIKCDITDRRKTLESVERTEPDLIIHAAAWTDVDGCEKEPSKAKKINVEGAANVTEAASRSNIPLIYISTDFVFDGKKKKPYREEDRPNPLNEYAESKLYGEEKVEALSKYIILRTSWLFGATGANFVSAILDKANKEKELKVVDDQIGSPTYAKDLATAIRRMIDVAISGRKLKAESRKPCWGIYHISNRGAVSWCDYAREILRLAGISSVKVIPIKSDELGRAAKRPAYSVLDNSKFEKIFGLKMRTWQEALRAYINEKNRN